MIQKIKIELFDNKFYSVTKVNAQQVNISYIDFYTTPASTPLGMATISPNIYNKVVKLKKLDISIPNNYGYNDDLKETYALYNCIKNSIDAEFFIKASELGELYRVNAPMNFLDFNIKKMKIGVDSSELSRKIISKFVTVSNYIASDGRIGPSQWIVSNSQTYKYILDNLDSPSIIYDSNNNYILFGNSAFIINDSIKDDIILLGRKNNNQQSGVHCFILADNDGNIITQEFAQYGGLTQNRMISIYYSIEDVGIKPQSQFLALKTRSIGYYRSKKLQRIKELYGED